MAKVANIWDGRPIAPVGPMNPNSTRWTPFDPLCCQRAWALGPTDTALRDNSGGTVQKEKQLAIIASCNYRLTAIGDLCRFNSLTAACGKPLFPLPRGRATRDRMNARRHRTSLEGARTRARRGHERLVFRTYRLERRSRRHSAETCQASPSLPALRPYGQDFPSSR